MFNEIFTQGMFAGWDHLGLGVLTGLIFGFLLQKAGLTRSNVIIGQFLLRDFTMLKTMLTAIVIGGLGIYAMDGMGAIEGLHIKSAAIWGNVLGGVLMGVGMTLLGFCPGTGMAAIGDGSRDAIIGALGMFFGAAAYAEVYPWMSVHVLKPLDLGKITLASATGISPWIILCGLALLSLGIFVLLERRERLRSVKASVPV